VERTKGGGSSWTRGGSIHVMLGDGSVRIRAVLHDGHEDSEAVLQRAVVTLEGLFEEQ
jgi:hypothetical protein